MVFVLGLLALIRFLDLPNWMLIYPAYLLTVLIVVKVIIEVIRHDFRLKRDPDAKTKANTVFQKMECEVKELNTFSLIAVILWLAILIYRAFEQKQFAFTLKLVEKGLTAFLMALTFIVFFSLISTLVGQLKIGHIPGIRLLRKNNSRANGH